MKSLEERVSELEYMMHEICVNMSILNMVPEIQTICGDKLFQGEADDPVIAANRDADIAAITGGM